MNEHSNNKTIAKNTLFLYFRMMLTMVVALYTSRVILQILGAVDYGLYQTVGGIVGLLTFLNGALSAGTSRFLTFEMGMGDFLRLKRTFSTVLTVHIILAFIMFLILETVGLWLVYHKLNIPIQRLDSAVIAYHFSVLAAMVTITQVPYTACIISHERMGIYAFMSAIEAVLKLVIVYLLAFYSWDKLSLYASLYFIVNLFVALGYRIYCKNNFKEAASGISCDKSILRSVLSYSGWNLLANTAFVSVNQGGLILINMFFNPIVVTAQTLANQVNMAATQFITSFRAAANPQIVKKYAMGDFDGSRSLLLTSTKFSYYLMLLLALPIFLVADNLLFFWLGNVPDYTVSFLRITIICSLLSVFDTSFYTALYAKGQIKENALISPLIYFVVFPSTYILYKLGFPPTILSFAMLISTAIVSIIVKPILVVKIAGYKWSEIISIFQNCVRVTALSLIIPFLVYYYRDKFFFGIIDAFIGILFISIVSVALSAWFFGIDKETRFKLFSLIIKTLK